jgi:hypothetical protein
MIHVLLLIVEIAGLAVVVWYAACGLNHMSRTTQPAMVLAVALVFAGAGSRLFLLIVGEIQPEPTAVMGITGIALAMLVNRRRSTRCPCLPNFISVPPDKESHA